MTELQWTKSNNTSDDFTDDIDWKPQGKDTLVGVLLSRRLVKTKYGEKTVLRIESDGTVKDKPKGTKYTVWCSRSALARIVEEHDNDLIPGRIIGLEAEDKVTLDDGRTFVPYRLGLGGVTKPTDNYAVDVEGEEPF